MRKGNAKIGVSDHVHVTRWGGIAAIQRLVRKFKLPEAINSKVRLFKQHSPYYESDHVLSIAYTLLAGLGRLEGMEELRGDVPFLDMLGARRFPDPTTAADFLRRFETPEDVLQLMEALNDVRTRVWRTNPALCQARAVIDVDGTVTRTTGQKKQGMGYSSHKRCWGYHPLLVSLHSGK